MKRTGESSVKIDFILDLLTLITIWFLSYFIRFYSVFESTKGIPEFKIYVALTPFLLIIWTFLTSITQFYRLQRKKNILRESFLIFNYSLISLFVFIFIAFFYDSYHYSRMTIALFCLLLPLSLIMQKSIKRKISRKITKKTDVKNCFILCNNESQIVTASLYLSDFNEKLKITGVIPILYNSSQQKIEEYCLRQAHKIHSIPESWPDFVAQNKYEYSFVILDHTSFLKIKTQVDLLSESLIQIIIIPDFSPYQNYFPKQTNHKQTFYEMNTSPLSHLELQQKRCFDFILSLTILVFLSPVLLFISLLIFLSSKGPIIYSQERIGLHGKIFTMYKFRTMIQNAEKDCGAVWTQKKDKRITKIGSFLRKTSLDELPQLCNVLKGNMSLIGPRPERLFFVEQFQKKIPNYKKRHLMNTGITGWAQINGLRGNTSLEKRIEFDLYYIKNWSLFLDFKILLMTIIKGFINPNAY